MAWTMTERAKASKVRREWYCDDCEHQWKTVHDQGEDEDYVPECPVCAQVADEVRRPIAMRGNAARALDFVQEMAERDYGVTNLRDHLQPGDTANMPPPPIQGAEADAITREIINAGGVPEKAGDHLQPFVKNFFGSNGAAAGQAMGANPFGVPTDINSARAMAAPAAAESRSMGADPVGLLHEAGKRGLDPTARKNLTIVSKGT